MNIVEDFQQHLVTAGLIDGDTGWPSVRRRENDSSAQLVVLTEDAGPPPEIKTASGIGDGALQEPAIQLRIRGNPGDSDGAEAKAREIQEELHGKLHEVIGGTEYLRVRAQTSAPAFIGFDEKGRPRFTISFLAKARI